MCGRNDHISQSKVQESEGYEAALLQRDCVRLWEFVRRTHLTHIYGDGDPMVQVNIQEQETRYAELKRGDSEFKCTFGHSDGCNARSDVGLNLVIETELERGQEFAVTPLQLCISRFLLLYIYLDHRIAISVDVG